MIIMKYLQPITLFLLGASLNSVAADNQGLRSSLKQQEQHHGLHRRGLDVPCLEYSKVCVEGTPPNCQVSEYICTDYGGAKVAPNDLDPETEMEKQINMLRSGTTTKVRLFCVPLTA